MHRIDTATKSADKHGAGKDGWTGGNQQGGVPPTQFSADFMDALQEEIARVIESSGLALNKASNDQLKLAINTCIRDYRPERIGVSGVPQTMRTHFYSVDTEVYTDLWQEYSQTTVDYNVDGGVEAVGLWEPPDGTAFTGEVRATLLNCGDITKRYHAVRFFSGHKTGGVVTVQEFTPPTGRIDYDISGGIGTSGFSGPSGLVRFRCAGGGAPPLKYNLMCTWRMHVLTTAVPP